MKNNLYISEKFYSIQGEGKTTGVPAIFVRLSGCNLLCQSSNWVCDSIEVWQKGTSTEFEDVLSGEEIEILKQGAHLVITGGEPMLHQVKILNFLNWLKEYHKCRPFVEIETNGTFIPVKGLDKRVDQWNVSPKLENSGEAFGKRYEKDALVFLNKLPTSCFKFVVDSEDDIKEIFGNYGFLSKNKVILMPAGDSQELLEKVRPLVIELCKKYVLRFTDRLHITAWNKKTGV